MQRGQTASGGGPTGYSPGAAEARTIAAHFDRYGVEPPAHTAAVLGVFTVLTGREVGDRAAAETDPGAYVAAVSTPAADTAQAATVTDVLHAYRDDRRYGEGQATPVSALDTAWRRLADDDRPGDPDALAAAADAAEQYYANRVEADVRHWLGQGVTLVPDAQLARYDAGIYRDALLRQGYDPAVAADAVELAVDRAPALSE